MKNNYSIALFAFLSVLLCPIIGWGTVGFAERHSQLHYNRYARIHWIHPGDGCDCGSYCFFLEKADQRFSGFRGLNCSLQKINVPEDIDFPVVLAQCCNNRRWLVYDLQTEEILFETDYYEAALAIGRAHGLEEPSFADAQDGAKGLHQTASSLFEEWAFLALMFSPFLAVAGATVFSFFLVLSYIAYRHTRKRKYLIVSIIFFIPALILWGLVIYFVFRVLYYMFLYRLS
jgi:hypothetical protein